jgi:hypothetical protein
MRASQQPVACFQSLLLPMKKKVPHAKTRASMISKKVSTRDEKGYVAFASTATLGLHSSVKRLPATASTHECIICTGKWCRCGSDHKKVSVLTPAEILKKFLGIQTCIRITLGGSSYNGKLLTRHDLHHTIRQAGISGSWSVSLSLYNIMARGEWN